MIDTSSDGFGFIWADKFKAGFAHDTTDADAAFLRDSQVPINMSAFGTALTNAAWRSKPSWTVIATEDKAFDIGPMRRILGVEPIPLDQGLALTFASPHTSA